MNVRLRSIVPFFVSAGMLLCSDALEAQDAIPAQVMPLASMAQINALSKSGDVVIAVGERGIVLRRDSDGSWVQMPSPVSTLLNAVQLHGAEGWAVGHDSVILVTKDGGFTWRIVQRDPVLNRPLLDVLFVTSRHGFAVGAFGLFQESKDGGETWEAVQVDGFDELPPHLNAIRQLNDGSILVVGEMGTVIHSKEGLAWKFGRINYEGSLFAVEPWGEEGAIVAGMRGNSFILEDPLDRVGKRIDLGTTKSIFSSYTSSTGIIYLGAGSGVIMIGDGLGNTSSLKHFSLVGSLGHNQQSAITSLLIDDEQLLAATYSGVVKVWDGL